MIGMKFGTKLVMKYRCKDEMFKGLTSCKPLNHRIYQVTQQRLHTRTRGKSMKQSSEHEHVEEIATFLHPDAKHRL